MPSRAAESADVVVPTEPELELMIVPPWRVNDLWPRLRPFVEKSVRRGAGRLDVEDVRRGTEEERYRLWVVMQGEDVIAVGASQILVFPGKSVLSVFMYSGERRAAQHLWPKVERYAREAGCAEVQIAGPRAWLRIFPDFSAAYTVFTKDVR
jgi:hypothetical protein